MISLVKQVVGKWIYYFFITSILFFIVAYYSNIFILNILACSLLTISVIIISSNFFFIAYISNCILLLLMPIYINKYHIYLLNQKTTNNTILFICWLLLISIINFLVLAYNFKNNASQNLIQFFKKINSNIFILKYYTIMRIFSIFTLYLIILYSVINTFGVLYTYLSRVSNEGLEAKKIITNGLDAIYFSATTFFTIGFGDITPSEYSEVTKRLVIIQAIIGHIITTVLWPVVIIFLFNNNKDLKEVIMPKSQNSTSE